MTLYRLIMPLAIIFLSGVLASEVFAQMGGMGGMGSGRSSRGGGNTQANSDKHIDPPGSVPDLNSSAQVSFRLSQLQDALKLTTEQAAPWQSFAIKVRALAEDIAIERGLSMDLTPGADPGSAKGLAHIDRTLVAARRRVAKLEDVDASAKALYNILTPEQKALADARLPTIVAPRAVTPAGGG